MRTYDPIYRKQTEAKLIYSDRNQIAVAEVVGLVWGEGIKQKETQGNSQGMEMFYVLFWMVVKE